jgi:hypothetical protein
MFAKYLQILCRHKWAISMIVVCFYCFRGINCTSNMFVEKILYGCSFSNNFTEDYVRNSSKTRSENIVLLSKQIWLYINSNTLKGKIKYFNEYLSEKLHQELKDITVQSVTDHVTFNWTFNANGRGNLFLEHLKNITNTSTLFLAYENSSTSFRIEKPHLTYFNQTVFNCIIRQNGTWNLKSCSELQNEGNKKSVKLILPVKHFYQCVMSENLFKHVENGETGRVCSTNYKQLLKPSDIDTSYFIYH